jgi:type III restriction enzyme
VLIVDEPQSVDWRFGGARQGSAGRNEPALHAALFGTHVDKHQMVYRLDAIDAYERQLVKQIEVASAEVDAGQNRAYFAFRRCGASAALCWRSWS